MLIPKCLLTQKLLKKINIPISFSIEKLPNYLCYSCQIYQTDESKMQLTQTCIDLNKFAETLLRKFSENSFLAADCSQKFIESVINNFATD